MIRLLSLALAAALACPVAATAQQSPTVSLQEWPVEWGGRVRDPAVAPDGRVWFVGQQGNYIAVFDPQTEQFRRYEVEEGTNPHNLIVDDQGIVWYAGNRNGRIGRLDPATGEARTIMTGEARDPHTLVFDDKGHIWFTSQGSNRVGRLNMATSEVELITRAVHRAAAGGSAHVIDMLEASRRSSPRTSPDFTEDGVHFSAKGNAALGTLIAARIAGDLERRRAGPD